MAPPRSNRVRKPVAKVESPLGKRTYTSERSQKRPTAFWDRFKRLLWTLWILYKCSVKEIQQFLFIKYREDLTLVSPAAYVPKLSYSPHGLTVSGKSTTA